MDFGTALSTLKIANLHRTLQTLSTGQGREAVINGTTVLLFSSNSYLDLSQEPSITQRAMRAIEEYGTGSGGSRLTTGTMTPHMELEKLLAAFIGSEACVAFTSGYTANVGVIPALAGKDSVIFSDALNHASIIDGCRLAGAKTVVYAHNDIDDLVAKIRELRPRKGLIVTDSVFSMDGDIARLPELIQLKRDHGLLLMIDDAHAIGVLGRSGRGALEHFGLSCRDVDVLMGTLSKAVPSEGGFICGSEAMCDYLRNTARSFIYTTALSPAVTAASMAGIDYIREHPQRVLSLQENVRYFSGRLSEFGIRPEASTPIVPVLIGEESAAIQASKDLLTLGVFVPCIRYPTVAKGQARLRFTLMATHTRSDMDYVITCLTRIVTANCNSEAFGFNCSGKS